METEFLKQSFSLKAAVLKLSVLFLLFTPFFVSAQNNFKVIVKFKVDGGNFENASAVVSKNGGSGISIPGKSSFDITLDFKSDYIISFSKPGYITKRIAINTDIPEDRMKQGAEPVEFTVVIFKQYEGVNTVVFNQPVGRYYFNKKIDDFDFDTDYTKSIQSAIQDAETALKQKKKEEDQQPPPPPKKDSTVVAQKKEEEKKANENPKNTGNDNPGTKDTATKSGIAANNINEDNKSNKGTSGESPNPGTNMKSDEDKGIAAHSNTGDDKSRGASGDSGQDKNKSASTTEGEDKNKGVSSGSGDDSNKSISSSSGNDSNKSLSSASGDDKSTTGSSASGKDNESKTLSGKSGDDANKNLSMSSGNDAGKNDLKSKTGEDQKPPVTITTTARTDNYSAPPPSDPSVSIEREEINEDKRSILNVRVTIDGRTTLYTRVAYSWGGVFYFKDSVLSISENFFRLSISPR